MTLRLAVTHRIESRFDQPVQLSTHWLRLRPAPHTRAQVEAYSLHVAPGAHFINWLRDPYENHLARLDLPQPVTQLTLTVELLLALSANNPFDFLVESYAAQAPFAYPRQLRKELAPYLVSGANGPQFTNWCAQFDREPRYIIEFLDRANRRVHEHITLTETDRSGVIDIEALLVRGGGSPWALAWLLTLTLRHLGLAARFVSGYRILAGPTPADPASASVHAWSEVFLPGAGWIGLDPAAAMFTNEYYIPLAAAPEPLRALPWIGYREVCAEQQQEAVTARVLAPAPSVWPFTAAAWGDVTALGHKIEQSLQAADVSLTVARSLNFVSVTEPTAPEWNTTALGPDKRRVAQALLEALHTQAAPGGVLQAGQSERYGGEGAPRWRLSCCFRVDGIPVWRNLARLAGSKGDADAPPPDARAFGEQLARALRLPASAVMPAYEDGLHQAWRAAATPAPAAEELCDPDRRRALAARLSAVHAEPAGYVLPLRWDERRGGWCSGGWTLRRDRLYLLPGDAALGFRLPLDSLAADDDAEQLFAERCQFEARAPLSELHSEVSARLTRVEIGTAEVTAADAHGAAGAAPRTALCVQVRDAALHVFLPPLTHLEHYLELIAAIEVAAESTNMVVWLEGYEPPVDHRLRRFILEPDTGVLRLQLPETANWSEHVALLELAYAQAARLGLSAQRLLIDGLRQPVNGVSAVILGGTSAADSPFLQQPHLLRSLIVYWQRHPSLSYFFTTQAGEQAPRPDEGRAEALYELGMALERIVPATPTPAWFPDRILRHLLADPAGNMRRAEWRVDELYDPARASRRLGQVTLRAFETAAHPQLAALQSLLVMALLARFAHKPIDHELLPWGAALHDRFLLPQPLWQDLDAVLRELAAVDLPLPHEWFAPFFDLHFPLLGTVQIGAIALELRMAHEPWPVLAEEVTAAGVARFVDSANERVQVRVTGLVPGRYVLACNGRRVPLQPGGAHDEFIAGVRYKASNPLATLHPTIPAFTALIFDLIDTWSGQAVGGCTYTIPSRSRLGRPAAIPAVGAGDPGGGPQAAPDVHTLVPWFVPQRGVAGQVLAHGSDQLTVRELPAEPAVGYVLDLTRAP
jgi:uncharacterized protein (DUF2126 family)